MYEVITGMVRKEYGIWNPDGMRRTSIERFDSYEDAILRYRAIDLRYVFAIECVCRSGGRSSMRDEGFYKELRKDANDELIEYDEFTYDDYMEE